MNCGIEVLKRLNELVDEDLSEVIETCEDAVDERGLSFYDVVTHLNQRKKCVGVLSFRLLKCTPYIAFVGTNRRGHYVLVEKIGKKVCLFDTIHGRRWVSKFWFYLFWSKKAIVFEKIT